MTAPADVALLASLQTATNVSLTDLADLNLLATSTPRYGASVDELLARRMWRSWSASRSARFGGSAPTPSSSLATFSTRQNSVASTSSAPPSSTLSCYICGDTGVATTYLPCGHRYCHPCLRQLFLLATKDESLHPAACCKKEIPSNLFCGMNLRERLDYRNASREFSMSDRLYCSNRTCSNLLGPARGARRMFSCTKCTYKTCAACKSPEHSLAEACAADTDDTAAIKLADQLHGARCSRCNRVVVRNGGCENV
ncbi:hypothetical protein JCM11641_007640 [Rhodosporidiobolus odoratus]